MPVYKLHYFNLCGRAEPIRLIFAAAGVQYQDIRYTPEEWQKIKQEGQLSPMGYLPVLEVDGKKLCESFAIIRYVARQCGLCPTDNFDIAQCDQIVDAVSDLFSTKMAKFFFEKDPEKKKTLQEEFDNTLLPAFLTNLTALLKSNNNGKGFFVGDKISYADICVFNLNINLIKTSPEVLEKFPELKEHYQRIGENPGIKEWIKKRPQTPF